MCEKLLHFLTDFEFSEMAKFEEGTESEIAHYYNDVETMRLVNAMANIIGK